MEDSEDPKHPRKCQFGSIECANYFRHSGCSILQDLQDNVGDRFNADIIISECQLICMRATTSLNTAALICPKHRFMLGIYYKPSVQCQYREHPKNSKSKAEKISWQLYSFVKSVDLDFVLGSMICKPCQKKLNKLKTETQMECENDDDLTADPDFVPAVPIVEDEEMLKRRERLDVMTNFFGMERVHYQINKNIEDMSTGSLNYFRSVHQRLQQKLTDMFCDLVAPGQEERMKLVLNEEQTSETHALANLKEAFDSCTSRNGRIAILTLVPKTYTKSEICQLFNCSFYEVEKARRSLKLYGACADEPKGEKVYSRLSFEKAQHFVNFLFSAGLLQEVAYGTTKLKLDSGHKIIVSDTILNGVHEHAVREYIVHCKEMSYHPLGRTILLKMLDKMKPHTRKKLAGVDSFVVEGIEAFEVI